MTRTASPLRYPGGKWRLSGLFERIINLNHRTPPTYVEPYAGGASLALALLFRDKVSEIHLNDLDPAVHAFWHSVLNRTAEMLTLVRNTPVTPTEWEKQREIYRSGRGASTLGLGFATFFLNRTSHSGILNGGMIGGKGQTGIWKIDARFNRSDLVDRIARVGRLRNRIHLSRDDALVVLDRVSHLPQNTLVYLDPPYFRTGGALYLNAYRETDHSEVRDALTKVEARWIVSYDDVPEVHALYRGYRHRLVILRHTARTQRIGREVMFFSDTVRVPRRWGLVTRPSEVDLRAAPAAASGPATRDSRLR